MKTSAGHRSNVAAAWDAVQHLNGMLPKRRKHNGDSRETALKTLPPYLVLVNLNWRWTNDSDASSSRSLESKLEFRTR